MCISVVLDVVFFVFYRGIDALISMTVTIVLYELRAFIVYFELVIVFFCTLKK